MTTFLILLALYAAKKTRKVKNSSKEERSKKDLILPITIVIGYIGLILTLIK